MKKCIKLSSPDYSKDFSFLTIPAKDKIHPKTALLASFTNLLFYPCFSKQTCYFSKLSTTNLSTIAATTQQFIQIGLLQIFLPKKI